MTCRRRSGFHLVKRRSNIAFRKKRRLSQVDNGGQCSRSCTLFQLLLATLRRADSRTTQASESSAGALPEKHFPRVWQLEKNKRLLLAGRCNASHNTQLTAYSPMIHSQELGVSEITGEEKKNKCIVLPSFAIKCALFSPADTSAHFQFSFQNKLSEH